MKDVETNLEEAKARLRRVGYLMDIKGYQWQFKDEDEKRALDFERASSRALKPLLKKRKRRVINIEPTERHVDP